MAGAAPWIGLGAGILGGVSRSSGHSAQAGVYRQSALIEEANAKLAKIKGKYNAAAVLQDARERIADSKRAADNFLANQQVGFAASNVEYSGTAMDVIDDQNRTFHHNFAQIWDKAQAQAFNINWGADMESWNSLNQANKYRYLASAEDAQADYSMLGGIIQGVGDFIDLV